MKRMKKNSSLLFKMMKKFLELHSILIKYNLVHLGEGGKKMYNVIKNQKNVIMKRPIKQNNIIH